MPSVVFGQPPVAEWPYRFQYPVLGGVQPTNNSAQMTNNWQTTPQGRVGPESTTPNIAVVNTPFNWNVYRGRGCAENAANPGGVLFQLPWWFPNLGPASDLNAGAQVNDGSVVTVFDFHMALAGAAFVYTADTTGLYFCLQVTGAGIAASAANQPPGGSTPTGGFGVLVNDDGGGGAQYEFVTWNAGGVLSRTAAPAGSVPDVTKWSTFRIVVISAAPGREATVYAYANGVDWITALDFDDVTLYRPWTLGSRNLGFGICQSKAGAAASLYWAVDAKGGRSTPEGVAYQNA